MRRAYIILILITLSLFSCERQKAEQQKPAEKKEACYAVAILPAPVLNTPDFSSVFGGSDGKTLKLNKKKLIREVEFIALPQTVFAIEETIKKDGHEILKVSASDYPYPSPKGYYIDSRFAEKRVEKPEERKKVLPGRDAIINNLISSKGAVYIWGGNYVRGLPEMLEFYKPSSELSVDIKTGWMLKGVDCSGLLYEATNGYTPRNVESLFNYGLPVEIKGKSSGEIAKKLRPLDIIVYKRHVLIVLNSRDVIESSISRGVHIKNLRNTIRDLSKKMKPVNDYEKDRTKDKFAVRRWLAE